MKVYAELCRTLRYDDEEMRVISDVFETAIGVSLPKIAWGD
jgi:hypothetical protein